jgi:hypothetical protein
MCCLFLSSVGLAQKKNGAPAAYVDFTPVRLTLGNAQRPHNRIAERTL